MTFILCWVFFSLKEIVKMGFENNLISFKHNNWIGHKFINLQGSSPHNK
jgi:hypothetical protein